MFVRALLLVGVFHRSTAKDCAVGKSGGFSGSEDNKIDAEEMKKLHSALHAKGWLSHQRNSSKWDGFMSGTGKRSDVCFCFNSWSYIYIICFDCVCIYQTRCAMSRVSVACATAKEAGTAWYGKRKAQYSNLPILSLTSLTYFFTG